MATETNTRGDWKPEPVVSTGTYALREQLAEARKAAAWQEITPENLPKKGAVLFMRLREAEAVSAGIATVDWQLSTVRGDYEQWFINPPAPEGSKP
jgi:hypothetical protein